MSDTAEIESLQRPLDADRNVRRRAERGATLTEQAYLTLEDLIATLELPPGAFLSELALSERLGIGRTPIREALQRLSRDGLVAVIPRRGILVSEIDARSQLELLEARRVLERLLARLAAERADARERTQFADIAADLRASATAADSVAFMRLDRRFNDLVACAAHNEFAARAIGAMASLSRRFWYRHYEAVGDLPLAARLHADVADAIAAHDPKEASAASDRLMDYIEDFTKKTLAT